MQFIPERAHMKAGKYIELASPWDLEKWGYVCVYVLQTLTYFSNNQLFVPTALLCLLVWFQVCLPKKVWSITKMTTVKNKKHESWAKLKSVRFNTNLTHTSRHFGERKPILVSLHSTHSQFASVHITYPWANENIDQIGKSPLDIYKHGKCTNRKNTAFLFSVVSMVLSMFSTEHLFSLIKFVPVLFCFPVILNAE